MATNTILGYSLLGVGLIIVIFSLFSSYRIFTGKKTAPQVFYSYATNTSDKAGSNLGTQDQVQNAVNDQIGKFLPKESISQLLNLTSWSGLAFILIYGGGQIASLGIKLLKKERDEESE